MKPIKILHTGDCHLGDLKGPTKDGANLRRQDTLRCMGDVVQAALKEHPHITIIAGDLFNRSRVWADTALEDINDAVTRFIGPLCGASETVLLLFGTQNHDNPLAFDTVRNATRDLENLRIYTKPVYDVVHTSEGPVQIVAVPGFDKGRLRTFLPAQDAEQEDRDATALVNQVFLGLATRIDKDLPSIVIGHYTVAGAESENGNVFLAGQDVVVTQDTLTMTGATLACFGHIHKPQQIPCGIPAYYCGSLNQLTFNDEPFEHGFYFHEIEELQDLSPLAREPMRIIKTTFHRTHERRHFTLDLSMRETEQFISTGHIDLPFQIEGAVVRVRYECTPEQDKALNRAELQKLLMDFGAFYVAEVTPQQSDDFLVRETTEHDSPMDCLDRWLKYKGTEDAQREALLELARPIITKADDGRGSSTHSGAFTPQTIEVKNYRSYTEAAFDFSPVRMAMVTGPNGVGKSSLFMDAISDCLFEQSRDDDTAGWVRDGTKSGAITFTFCMGQEKYRVIRTRTKSGRGTLALQHYDEGRAEWTNESDTTMKLTQKKIELLIGMDYTTFCSIALIRQDAYGLFLEAGSDRRMEVLSNLLDLGLYNRAQDIAKGLASEQRKTIAVMKDRIGVLNERIDLKQGLNNEAEEVHDKIERLTQEIAAQETVIAAAQQAQALRNQLDKRIHEIEAQVSDYDGQLNEQRSLLDRLEQQRNAATEKGRKLPQAKQAAAKLEEARQLMDKLWPTVNRADRLREGIERDEQELQNLSQELLEVVGAITRYEAVTQRSDEIRSAQAKQADLQQQRAKAQERLLDCDKEKQRISELRGSILDFRREAEIAIAKAWEELMAAKNEAERLEGTGCPDIENASCLFLSSAKKAQAAIPELEERYKQAKAAGKTELERRRTELDQAIEAMNRKYGTPVEDIKAIDAAIRKLKPILDQAPELDRAEARKTQAEATKESITQKQEKLRAQIAGDKELLKTMEPDVEKYETAGRSVSAYSGKAATLADCEAAMATVQTLNPQITRTISDISRIEQAREDAAGRLLEAKKERAQDKNTDHSLTFMESTKRLLTSDLSVLHSRQGSIEKALEDIEEAERQAAGFRFEISEASRKLDSYVTLAQAFGLEGIQYMIVRGVVPEIMNRANDILHQMTGGRMSVDIRTEKQQKSSKKEVNSLEVWISSIGGSIRPYLSHSGGEKVRAALAVTFGLADVKARRAGIQIGMLHIDEPPFLDAEGTEAYADALMNMAERNPNVRVLAISHDPAMTARFPQSIQVSAGSGPDKGSVVTMA